MPAQLKSIINSIYAIDSDFLVLGLTGRTGSGCSSVAKILQMEMTAIVYALYGESHPANNEQRQQRIIYSHFQKNWQSFLLIQVRSLITLALVEKDIDVVIDTIKATCGCESFDEKTARSTLAALAKKYKLTKNSTASSAETIDFYTGVLPAKCEEFRSVLGSNIFTQFYQRIGKNIRMSG